MTIKAAASQLKSISRPESEPVRADDPTHLLIELIKAAQLAGARFSVQMTLCKAEHPDHYVLVDASADRLFWHPGKYPRSLQVPAEKARSVEELSAFLVEVLQGYDDLPPQL
jgi:hypothetical protein